MIGVWAVRWRTFIYKCPSACLAPYVGRELFWSWGGEGLTRKVCGLIGIINVQLAKTADVMAFFGQDSFNVGFSVTVHECFASMSLILPMLCIFLSRCWSSTAEKTFWLFHLRILSLSNLTFTVQQRNTNYLVALGRVGIQLQPSWPVPLKWEQTMRCFNTEVGIRKHLF